MPTIRKAPVREGPIHGSVHAVKGRFNHLYILNDEHITVIDPEFPSSVDRLLGYVTRSLHRSPRDIKAIFITHAHVDHIGGLGHLLSKTDAQVALPQRSKPIIDGEESYKVSLRDALCLLSLMIRHRAAPAPRDLFTANIVGQPPLPNRFPRVSPTWLRERDRLPFRPEWQVIETPGHTRDSISLYNAQTESLICGDLILNLNGRLYLNPILLEDWNEEMRSLEKLRALPVRHLYPGYGPPVSHPLVLAKVITRHRCRY